MVQMPHAWQADAAALAARRREAEEQRANAELGIPTLPQGWPG